MDYGDTRGWVGVPGGRKGGGTIATHMAVRKQLSDGINCLWMMAMYLIHV